MRLIYAALLAAALAAPLPSVAQQEATDAKPDMTEAKPEASPAAPENKAASTEAPAAPLEPEPEVKITRNGDWEVACREGQPNSDEPKACEMRQILINDETKQEWLRIAVGFPPNGDRAVLRIFTPLGVLLQPGMELKIDNGKVERVQYAVCLARPPRCLVAGPMTDAMVNALKRGNGGTITFVLPNNQKVNAPFSLTGFTKSYNSLPR